LAHILCGLGIGMLMPSTMCSRIKPSGQSQEGGKYPSLSARAAYELTQRHLIGYGLPQRRGYGTSLLPELMLEALERGSHRVIGVISSAQ
jgi:L-amino acid N-acyltransferase YncA